MEGGKGGEGRGRAGQGHSQPRLNASRRVIVPTAGPQAGTATATHLERVVGHHPGKQRDPQGTHAAVAQHRPAEGIPAGPAAPPAAAGEQPWQQEACWQACHPVSHNQLPATPTNTTRQQQASVQLPSSGRASPPTPPSPSPPPPPHPSAHRVAPASSQMRVRKYIMMAEPVNPATKVEDTRPRWRGKRAAHQGGCSSGAAGSRGLKAGTEAQRSASRLLPAGNL